VTQNHINTDRSAKCAWCIRLSHAPFYALLILPIFTLNNENVFPWRTSEATTLPDRRTISLEIYNPLAAPQLVQAVRSLGLNREVEIEVRRTCAFLLPAARF
jgi:hypothetical protein